MNSKQIISNLYELMISAELDPAVGIRIAHLTGNDHFSLFAAEISPHKKIAAHYHKNGVEIYQLVEGEGVMYTGKPNTDGGVAWNPPFSIRKGDSVFNRIGNTDSVFISAPKPVFSDNTIEIPEIARALRADKRIIADSPISIVNAGLQTLIVPISRLDDILSIAPDLEELKEFCINQSIDIITVFTEEVSNKNNAFRTRVFAPTFGYLEDPATGSGNSAFGYYLYRNGKWQDSIMSIEQNSFFDNANIVKLELSKDEHNEAQVSFGGSAVVRINGEYHLV